MADPPLPYPEADKGGSYPFGYITKQPTPPDGLVAPEHPPQAALGNPPAAGYISYDNFNQVISHYSLMPLLQHAGYPPPEGSDHGHTEQSVGYTGSNTDTTVLVTVSCYILIRAITGKNDIIYLLLLSKIHLAD